MVVETDPGMEQYVSTVVENGILKISIKNQGKTNLRFKKLFVDVKGPNLTSIKTTSGASLSTLNEVIGDGCLLYTSWPYKTRPSLNLI